LVVGIMIKKLTAGRWTPMYRTNETT